MRQFLLLLMLLGGFTAFAQGTVTGVVTDPELGGPLPGANVVETGTSNGAVTDFNGNFTLEVSGNSGSIDISFLGFVDQTVSFTLTNGSADLGTVTMTADANTLAEVVLVGSGIVDLAEDRKTPVAVSTITAAQIQSKTAGNREFVEAIQYTPSVYVSNQAGGFGDSQVFLRGFDQVNTAFLLNGQPINGMEDGRMYWSNWSGMADVAEAVQVQRGLGSSKLAISSVGGTVNIVSKSTEKKEGGFVRMMAGNDSYFKGTVSYNTGVSDSGWAFSALVDHWQGHRKYAIGTAGQGQNYLFSVGYKPNEKHTFNLLLTGAPQWHDQNFSDSLEDYKELGEKQNSNSGFFDGERYTERRNYYHKPVANLNWDYKINEMAELSTVLYASWGRGGGTGSLGSSSNRIRVGGDGANQDEIDFDTIFANNSATGVGNFGNSYHRRASVNNHNLYGLLSNLSLDVADNWDVNIGFDGRTYTGDHFRQVNDLLGLTSYQDNFRTDRPSDYTFTNEYEADPWAALFDSASEEDRYQYDYSETINYLGGFGQAEYAADGFSAFVQGAVSTQSYQREGRFVGTGDGLGESEQVSKVGYNIKGGLGYDIDKQNALFFNSGFYSRQPFLDNIFADIRNSNALVSPDVENEEITGLEAGYRLQTNELRFNVDMYYTEWGNRFLSINGPQLDEGVFSTYRLTDVTQLHKGIEVDLEYRPKGACYSLTAFGQTGRWEYRGSSPYTLQNDETSTFVEEGEINLTGARVGNAPQTQVGAGLNLDLMKNVTVDFNWIYNKDLYEFVDPSDVAEAAFAGVDYKNERLNPYSLFDGGLTWNFMFGDQKVQFRSNVYNLFNNGYVNQKDPFGYYLGIRRTYNASLRLNF
ncbi:TonB-dependent receptor [Flavobacteriaceae bacterium]|nr:TonB-dependent receptor [Flavobacteriaceae bacterium]